MRLAISGKAVAFPRVTESPGEVGRNTRIKLDARPLVLSQHCVARFDYPASAAKILAVNAKVRNRWSKEMQAEPMPVREECVADVCDKPRN